MGRPLKENVVRDCSGRSRGDDEKHYRAIRLAYRARDMALDGVAVALDKTKGADPSETYAGFTLGRLWLRKRISEGDPSGISYTQYRAGEAWAYLCHRHAAIMGYELKPLRSAAHFGVGGRSVAPEPDEQIVLEIRRKWSDCYNAIMAACRDHGLNVRDVTYMVCIAGCPISAMRQKDFGDLRIGLNTLAKVLDIADEGGHGRNAKSQISAWTG